MELRVTLVPDSVDEDGAPILVGLDDAINAEVVRAVRDAIAKKAGTAVEQALKDEISDWVKEQVTQTILAPIQRTNSYGSPVGEPVSLVDLILECAQSYLSAWVNCRGEDDRHGSTGSMPRAAFIARQVTEQIVKEAIEPEVAKVREAVKAQVSARVGELIVETMTKLAK